MTVRPPLSRSVKIVAWLFLGLGAFAATELVWKLAAEGVLKVNLLGVPLLVVGYGLLKRRDFWRKCALAAAPLHVALAGLMRALVIRALTLADVRRRFAA